jgi:PAS domain S-box-containing protein
MPIQGVAGTADLRDRRRGSEMSEHIYGDQAWGGPYTTYVRRLGGGPTAEFEPIFEALPDGAFAIDVLGRVLYVNRRYAELAGIVRGMTLEEVIAICDIRDLAGHALREEALPEARVLLDGEEIGQSLLRMRSPVDGREFVVASDCRPVRGLDGRVIGAVVIAREISEEMALAIGVRQVAEGQASTEPISVG